MKLAPNGQAALDTAVEQFKSGDLSPIVKIARLQRNCDPIPSDTWSLSNRILAFVQTGGTVVEDAGRGRGLAVLRGLPGLSASICVQR